MSCQQSDIPVLCTKNSRITRGQRLQVVRKKCIAKSCFEVQKKTFRGEINSFSLFFYFKWFWAKLIRGKSRFLKYVHDKIYRQTPLLAWGLEACKTAVFFIRDFIDKCNYGPNETVRFVSRNLINSRSSTLWLLYQPYEERIVSYESLLNFVWSYLELILIEISNELNPGSKQN